MKIYAHHTLILYVPQHMTYVFYVFCEVIFYAVMFHKPVIHDIAVC